MFNALTAQQVLTKAFDVLDKHNEPGWHQVAPLDFSENGYRICLYRPIDNVLCLRLEREPEQPLDSHRILDYFNGWRTAENFIENTKEWLQRVKQI